MDSDRYACTLCTQVTRGAVTRATHRGDVEEWLQNRRDSACEEEAAQRERCTRIVNGAVDVLAAADLTATQSADSGPFRAITDRVTALCQQMNCCPPDE